MSLASLFTAAFLILLGLSWLTWITVSVGLLGALALIAGVLIVLEGMSVFTYKVNR